MKILLKNIKELVTCRWDNAFPKKGKMQNDIGLIKNGSVVLDNDKIIFSGKQTSLKSFLNKEKVKPDIEIDCAKNVVMPGFIDSHSHFVFAGSRENEYEMKIAGRTYEEIAKTGGGIISTVKAVRKATESQLLEAGERRIKNFFKFGVTTLEGKSGYGLDAKSEIKVLRVLNKLNRNNSHNLDIIPTFLGAHAVPAGIDKEDYMNEVMYEMIPLIAQKKLAKFIDVFCEKGYFTAKESEKILLQGKKFGLIPKLHTDQFNSIGGIETAVNVNAISVDHLEVLNDADIKRMSRYNFSKKFMIATLLPGVSYFLDISYQPARKLIENNVPVALATDFNPGTAMTENIQIIMSFASRMLKMSSEEIINAVTINSAFALNIQDKIGSIQENKQADLLIFDMESYKELVYNFAVNRISYIIKKGRIYSIDNIMKLIP
jgi:imidazolonepropionase